MTATNASSPVTPVDQTDRDLQQIEQDLQATQSALTAAQESEKRALADYQNLVRRTQDDRIRAIKFANRELLSALLEPLDHLNLASTQLKDKGLAMVIQQFDQVLKLAGLEEIATEGQVFDPRTMEAVEVGEHKEKVVKCLRKGYTLHGEVLQPAKVVVD